MLDCVKLAVTDIRVFRRPESVVCCVSDGVSGYGDDLVNYGRIADLLGDPGIRLIVGVPERVAAGAADRDFLRVDVGGGGSETK